MQSNASKVISWLGANRDYILIVCLALLLTSYIFSSESIIGENADVNEIYKFLERDLTDERMYIDNIYDCEYFAKDVQYNANTLGIRCAVVLIVSNSGECKGIDHCFHALVGFDVNGTTLYFDPQDDRQVYPENVYDIVWEPWEIGTYRVYL